ncbi:MKL2 protein, partial [Amia calva]|nr:MKL2 protein [Amia calva]
ETLAEPSLQATQLKLKRARLADDLNEKIAQRPGPMELVEKNILPVDSSVKEAIIVGQVNYPKTLDVYSFDEDSSDALSPEQPASQESQGSAASPVESRVSEASSPLANSTLQYYPAPISQPPLEFLRPVSTNEQHVGRLATPSQPITTTAPSKPGPTLVKQSQTKSGSDKSRSKKSKDAKPRVKKLKYHQYIPPDQKGELSEAPMDSSYARLLQQQQLFLQLQILNQQQHQHYNYQAILPAPLKPVTDSQNNTANMALNNNNNVPTSIMVSLPTAGTGRPNNNLANRKPGPLPANLDDMKVAELKMELKLRGLHVSGTKTDLIERLKYYLENTTSHLSSGHQAPLESMSSTPPVSPVPSELSNLSAEDAGRMDSNSEGMGGMSPAQLTAVVMAVPGAPLHKSGPEDPAVEPDASEKDRRLHEKEQQIEELMRKLEQEQRLVEELKMQLEVEKRSQQQQPEPSPPAPIEDPQPTPQPTQLTTLPQFFISHQQVSQVLGQPQTLLTAQPGTQILLPVSLPGTTASIQLPTASLNLQPVLQAAVSTQAPGLIQASVHKIQPQPPETSSPHQLPSQDKHMSQAFPSCTTTSSGFKFNSSQLNDMPQCFLSSSPESRPPPRASPSHSLPNGPTHKYPVCHLSPLQPASPSQQPFLLQQSIFPSHAPKSKDPPRYEEAVKQTRSLQTPTHTQGPTATSQQMDDLFAILIESGEISPFIREDPPQSAKMMPVTASITTLPINTVLSRPPPQVQVAPPPSLVDPTPSLASLASDNQLEAFLEGTLGGDAVTRPRDELSLIEELHCQLLDQPHSPMDTSELHFSDGPPAPSFDLHDTNLDNMEWLDLTMPGPAGGLNPLGISPGGGVFSSDFLDAHDLQLHWD